MSCDEWIGKLTQLCDCKKYLFVVGNTEKYKENVVEILTNKSHLNTNYEYVVLIEK